MTFHELATTAAIGTGQRPFRADDLPPALRTLVDPAAEPALQLLDAAAGWEAVRRARVPSGEEPEDLAEAPETRPEPSPTLTSLLRRILELPEGDRVLTETCSALHAAGLRLPHRLLLPVLKRTGRQPEQFAATRPVLGARGEWLLQALPGLIQQRSVPQPTHWDETLRLRVGWLSQLNRADPAAAVELLERSWPEEALDNRAEFLGVFEAQPHPRQIDFLEKALLDRSERVARVARATLAKLPASPWRDRMAGYAAGLRIEDGSLVLAVAPSGRQATRDGVTGRDAGSVIAAAVPPSLWPSLLGLPATAVLERCREDAATVLALGRAAAVFGDAELATLVLPRLEKFPEPTLAAELLAVVDIPTRLAVAERAATPRLALSALEALPAPWPQQVVDIALTRLDQWRAARRPEAAATFRLIEQAVSPWLAATAIRRINPEPRHSTETLRQVTRLITVLTLRAAVADEIRPYLNQENR